MDAQSGPVTDTQIFQAPTDGSGPVTAIYTGSSVGQPIVDGSGLASDATKLYSADFVQGRVHSLNPDGSGITQLGPNRYGGFFDREHANHIAVDGGIAYIADSGRAGFPDTPPRVQTIPTAGGSFSTLFTGSLPGFSPDGIAVDSGTIYLTNGTEILQMPTSGGIPSLLVSDPGFVDLANVTFFDNALYVRDRGASTIWRVDLSDQVVPEASTFVIWSVLGILMGGLGVVRQRRTLRITGSSNATDGEPCGICGS